MERNEIDGRRKKGQGCVLFIAVGLCVFCITMGIILRSNYNHLRKVCTETTEGIVTEVDEYTQIYLETDDDGYSTTRAETMYSITIGYEVNGNSFNWTLKGIAKCPLNEGDKVTVCYNPDSPDESYIKGHWDNDSGGWFWITFGCLLFAALGVAIYRQRKK